MIEEADATAKKRREVEAAKHLRPPARGRPHLPILSDDGASVGSAMSRQNFECFTLIEILIF
jgi:hypothetical protein